MLVPSDRSPGLLVGPDVELPPDLEVGGHVVIHAGTRIGSRVVIGDGAVLGRQPVLGPRSTASRAGSGPLVLEDRVRVGSGAVVLAGVRLGEDAVVADQAHVRERSVVGAESLVGRGVGLENDVVLGARVRVQAGAYLTAHCTVEDDVFVAPNVTTTNDQTMGRRPAGTSLRGAVIRRAARIGACALLLPGIEIGEEAVVASAAVVTRDVPEGTLVMGVPARHIRGIRDDERLAAGSR